MVWILIAVCIASGGSLTQEDCELVRNSGHFTIAVNNSWKLAPFCNVIYAGDVRWWEKSYKDITIDAERWICQNGSKKYGCKIHHVPSTEYNSGMRAIQFAMWKGFKRIILLGYDCSLKNGYHWHGKHNGMVNPSLIRISKWHNQFNDVASEARALSVTIQNCSRYTELTCFQVLELEEALCQC